jgi:hypothetical protein
MDNIIEPNDTFDFSKLCLSHPTGIQGGAYFTKIEYNKKPLYIQTNKIQTKQGFIKSGKKYYCDLMFDNSSENLIHWFENLEERCQKIIFERKNDWFENNLEQSDIETAFNSTIRVYKSGKFYLVRTNVKNNINNLPAVNIFNENKHLLTMDDVNSETNIISILEIQGIKFTSRNFQIEIELKQVMILDNELLFQDCLIKTNKTINETQQLIKNSIETLKNDNINTIPSLDVIDPKIELILEENNLEENNLEENHLEENHLEENHLEEFEPNISELNELNNVIEEKNDNIQNSFEIDLEELSDNDNNDLKEINTSELSLENLEKIQLKKPNQVYFELYKEARNKAKEAKKNAILAYLEAKNIKKTYMLENLNDSDSDFDAEIDDASESELDKF